MFPIDVRGVWCVRKNTAGVLLLLLGGSRRLGKKEHSHTTRLEDGASAAPAHHHLHLLSSPRVVRGLLGCAPHWALYLRTYAMRPRSRSAIASTATWTRPCGAARPKATASGTSILSTRAAVVFVVAASAVRRRRVRPLRLSVPRTRAGCRRHPQ